MRISSAFPSLDSGEVAATGCFSSEIAAEGRASAAIRKRESDARSRIISLYLSDALPETSLRLLPDPGAVHCSPGRLRRAAACEGISLTRRYSWTARFGP